MAYSNNPNLPSARAMAMKLLLIEQLPLALVARKCGVNRTTIWRWRQKWLKLNENIQFDNPNRPSRSVSLKQKLTYCRWNIATLDPTPHSFPNAICSLTVDRVLELRYTLKRCAEVIWHHLNIIDKIRISLSSVRRILKRHHCFDGARKKRLRPDNPRRPHPSYPGELVQTDTIHYICPTTHRRRYVYTVIDLFTRMAHAEIHSRILPGLAAGAVLRAQDKWGFKVSMIQADNGPEFSRYFEQVMSGHGIVVRHSRLGRPNDNAHIERFNRTIQEEAIGSRISSRVANATLQMKIDEYIEYYNTKRIHLGLQLRIPAEMLQSF
jgi:transposase InsO family protein